MQSKTLSNRNNKCDIYTKLVEILLVWLVFQDFALSIVYKLVPNVLFVKLLFHTKDFLLLFLMLVSFFFKRRSGNKLYFYIFAYLLLCFLALVFTFFQVGGSSIVKLLASFRSAILLPGLILIGLGTNRRSMKRFFDWYSLKFITFVAIFGIVDYFLDKTIGTIPFWTETIGFGHYLEDIKNNVLINGLPGNFYGQYGGEFFTQKRLVGFWGTPLTSGYGLLISVLYSFSCFLTYKKGSKKQAAFLVFCINFIALLLTFTRAIILPSLVAIALLFIILKPKCRSVFVLTCLFLCIVVFSALREKIMSYIYDGSTIEHINQVVNSFSQVSIFGDGFGSFGIYSSVGTESTYITLLGEIGAIGLFLFVFIYLYGVSSLLKIRRKSRRLAKNHLFLTMLFASLIYLATGFISEQLTAFTTIAPFGLFFGVFQRGALSFMNDSPVSITGDLEFQGGAQNEKESVIY